MSRTRRQFSPQFKAQIVLELLQGKSPAELCRKHKITHALLCAWRKTFFSRMPDLFGEPVDNKLQQRIDELEQILGQKTCELELLKKASRLLTGP